MLYTDLEFIIECVSELWYFILSLRVIHLRHCSKTDRRGNHDPDDPYVHTGFPQSNISFEELIDFAIHNLARRQCVIKLLTYIYRLSILTAFQNQLYRGKHGPAHTKWFTSVFKKVNIYIFYSLKKHTESGTLLWASF